MSNGELSTIYVENILNGQNEWQNIQEIIRTTFKGICDVVRSQGILLKDLEKQIQSRATKTELTSGLAIKANLTDVMRTFSEISSSIDSRPTNDEISDYVDDKFSKLDLQYRSISKAGIDELKSLLVTKLDSSEFEKNINIINLKIEEFNRDNQNRLNSYVLLKDFNQLSSLVDSKANIEDVNEVLNTKASKESVINALQKKVNKSEFDNQIASKVDKSDFQSHVILNNSRLETLNDLDSFIAKLENKIDKSEFNEFKYKVENKVSLKDFELMTLNFEELKKNILKRVDEIDQDMDLLVDNVKKESQNQNIILNNFDVNKIDFKEFEIMRSNFNQKQEEYKFIINDLRSSILEDNLKLKADISADRDKFEDDLRQRFSFYEKNFERNFIELGKISDHIEELDKKRRFDIEENSLNQTNLLENIRQELSNEIHLFDCKMNKIFSDFEKLINRKIDINEFEAIQQNIIRDLGTKSEIIELDNLYKNILKLIKERNEELQSNFIQKLSSLEISISKSLDKKVNSSELNSILNTKADFAAMTNSLSSKAALNDLERIRKEIEFIQSDQITKINDKYDLYFRDIRKILDETHKELASKSSIKETISLIKNKADIDDVNKALTQIHEELDTKISLEQFSRSLKTQSLINEALCSENCVGRWLWKSGVLKSGYNIPWEIQTVNTSPDNFLWEKDKISIMVLNPGLYELNLAIYSGKSPSIQILINGEPILTAVNSSNSVVYHNSNVNKNLGKYHSNITGLSLIEFLAIPEKGRISISFTGGEGAEGFLGLRKL